MGMRKVLVPPRPGLLSAVGLLHAEVRADFSLTRLVRLEPSSLRSMNAGLKVLGRRGGQWLKGEREASGIFQWFADLRYFGQNFELALPLANDRLDEAVVAKLTAAFHVRHKEFYGYDMREQPVEVVNLRLTVKGERRALPHDKPRLVRGQPKQAVLEKRRVWFDGEGYVAASVYDRERLPSDCRVRGPAIIEQMDTTTVVPPSAHVRSDRAGYLHLELAAVESGRSAAWLAA